MVSNAEETIQSLETMRELAIDAMDWANPDAEFTDANAVYDGLSPLDSKTYHVESDIHEYELIQFVGELQEPMGEVAPAWKIIVSTSLLVKLIEVAPEHLDRLEVPATETADDHLRGFQ